MAGGSNDEPPAPFSPAPRKPPGTADSAGERSNDLKCGPVPARVHEIEGLVPGPVSIRKQDLEIEVRARGELIGWLDISQGGVDWTPAGYRRTFSRGWEDFNRLMQDRGRSGPLKARARKRRRRSSAFE